ncbi:hypothetical protein FRB97_000272 [Tulasnella sp. 331]|nr:hypothetical protein FRB97_000272 [Tulasnella sp. 331]
MQNKLEKHVHSLSSLAAYDCPDFTDVLRRLTSILNPLDGLRRSSTRDLTYPDIRRQLLRIPSIQLCFFYRPQTAMDVALGDIGYMSGARFVRVANIKEDVAFETALNAKGDLVRSAPPLFQNKKLGNHAIK